MICKVYPGKKEGMKLICSTNCFIKCGSLVLQTILLYWKAWDYFIITLGKKYGRDDILKLQHSVLVIVQKRVCQ